MTDTLLQYEHCMTLCRNVFEQKMKDYGTAWRVLRPESITDQLYIKAMRIRTIETKREQKIADNVRSEYIGIVNYALMAIIQLELQPATENVAMPVLMALDAYNLHATAARDLMMNKNHDYNEAWRGMRISSYTDLILMKILRTKQIEDNQGATLVSEGVEANYADMINYAIFALIKLEFNE